MSASSEKTPKELINELHTLAQPDSASPDRIKEIVDILNSKYGEGAANNIRDELAAKKFTKEMVQKIFKAVNNNSDNYFYDDITKKNSVCFLLHKNLPIVSLPPPISQTEIESIHLTIPTDTSSRHLIQFIKKQIEWHEPHSRGVSSITHIKPLDAAVKCLNEMMNGSQEDFRKAYDNLVKAQSSYESSTSLASSISPNAHVKKLCELAIMQSQPKYDALPPAPVSVHVSGASAAFFGSAPQEETKQPQAAAEVKFPSEDERPKNIKASLLTLGKIYDDIVNNKKPPYSKKEAPQVALLDAVNELQKEGITQEKIDNIEKNLLPKYAKVAPLFLSSTIKNTEIVLKFAQETFTKGLAQQVTPPSATRKRTG